MTAVKLARNGLPSLAYIKHAASRTSARFGEVAGGVFCSGFSSTMEGIKAKEVEKHFVARNLDFVRFDYTDVGKSADFKTYPPKLSFKQWKEDLLTVLNELTHGPQILIGSSMGAWLSMLACLEHPERVAGLMLIAPAVDFFERFQHVIPDKARFDNGEILMVDGPYGQYPIRNTLFMDGAQLSLLKNEKIDIKCPVRILHAMNDVSAPYEVSLQLMQKINSQDVALHLIKSADHRMSADSDVKLLNAQLDLLFDTLGKKTMN